MAMDEITGENQSSEALRPWVDPEISEEQIADHVRGGPTSLTNVENVAYKLHS
jgi:hypothetical protein